MPSTRTMLILTSTLCMALACAGLEDISEPSSGSSSDAGESTKGESGDYSNNGSNGASNANLSEPWGSMGLPIQGGSIFIANDQLLTVQYSSGGLESHFNRYRDHFNSSYDIMFEDNSGGTMTTVFSSGGTPRYTISGVDAAGMATISVVPTNP